MNESSEMRLEQVKDSKTVEEFNEFARKYLAQHPSLTEEGKTKLFCRLFYAWKDENPLKERARGALLQHFSSKSTMEATMVLSAVLAIFAFFQTLGVVENWTGTGRTLYEVGSLTFLLFVAFRATGRLLYWGTLAGAILRAKPKDRRYVERKIANKDEEEVTYYTRFSYAIHASSYERYLKIANYFSNTIVGSLCSLLGLSLFSLWFFTVAFEILIVVGIVFGSVLAGSVWHYIRMIKDYEAKKRAECNKCGETISRNSRNCPVCGAENNKSVRS